jgi:hypothetical protein
MVMQVHTRCRCRESKELSRRQRLTPEHLVIRTKSGATAVRVPACGIQSKVKCDVYHISTIPIPTLIRARPGYEALVPPGSGLALGSTAGFHRPCRNITPRPYSHPDLTVRAAAVAHRFASPIRRCDSAAPPRLRQCPISPPLDRRDSRFSPAAAAGRREH